MEEKNCTNYIYASSQKNDRKAKILCLVIALLSIKNILFAIPILLSYRTYINATVAALVALMCIYDFICDFRKKEKMTVITILLFVIFCLFQMLFFENNQVYFCETIPDMVVYGVIPFVLAYEISNYELLFTKLKTTGCVIIVFGIIGLYGFVSSSNVDIYDMSYGNYIVIGVAILEYSFLKERKRIYGIFFFIGFLELLIVGSRGPMLVLSAVFVLYALFVYKLDKQRPVKQIVVVVLLSAFVLFFFVCFENITNRLILMLGKLGVKSRTLSLLISNEIFNDSGRGAIYDLSIDLINKHWLFGIGTEGLKGLGYSGLTPHNTYLELLLYYGVIIGGILIIALVFIWVHGLIYKKDKALNELIIIWIALYVSRSFTGQGVLTSINFWLLLAFCLKSFVIHYKRRNAV